MPRPLKEDEAFRTIGEAAAELGLQTHVLRFWQGHFPQITPMILKGGRRMYRPGDMAVLRFVQRALHVEKLTIVGALRQLEQMNLTSDNAFERWNALQKPAAANEPDAVTDAERTLAASMRAVLSPSDTTTFGDFIASNFGISDNPVFAALMLSAVRGHYQGGDKAMHVRSVRELVENILVNVDPMSETHNLASRMVVGYAEQMLKEGHHARAVEMASKLRNADNDNLSSMGCSLILKAAHLAAEQDDYLAATSYIVQAQKGDQYAARRANYTGIGLVITAAAKEGALITAYRMAGTFSVPIEKGSYAEFFTGLRTTLGENVRAQRTKLEPQAVEGFRAGLEAAAQLAA